MIAIDQTANRLRKREVSAVELAQESLAKIREAQPRFNAFITITDDVALEQARRADEDFAKGIDRGPLQGIPYALKDLFDTKGIRTTGGTKIFADRIPDRDCTVYQKLRNAGAVLMGKTALHELAYGVTTNNPHFGPVRNPHDLTRIPGGSSGGSGVAVAAGLVSFAMGSDTGGSIRIPAAYCGCVGLKPTFGRVSRFGTMPLGGSLDHMGPMTASSRDAALVMNAIAGYDPRDDSSSTEPGCDFASASLSPKKLRVGVAENFFNDRVIPEIATAFDEAVHRTESTGARIVRLRVPDLAHINAIGRVILLAEVSALMDPYRDRRADIGPDVQALLDQGRLILATDYVNAQRLRRKYQREWSRLWREIDVLFTPTAPIFAPLIGQTEIEWGEEKEDVRLATTRLVRAINVLGLPALSVPLRNTDLPASLQIIAPPMREDIALAVGTLLE